MTHETPHEWEKRFDDRFLSRFERCMFCGRAPEDWDEICDGEGEHEAHTALSEKIKDFIRTELTLSRKEARREANLIRQEAIEECKKIIESKLKWMSYDLARETGVIPDGWTDIDVAEFYGKGFVKSEWKAVLDKSSFHMAMIETLSALEKLKDNNQ